MPQIIVAADRGTAFGEGAVAFRERVSVADFESAHFANQLVERLGWAVEDADQMEKTPAAAPGVYDAEPGPGNPEEPDRTDQPRGGSVAANARS
jgi:hypothetical protein